MQHRAALPGILTSTIHVHGDPLFGAVCLPGGDVHHHLQPGVEDDLDPDVRPVVLALSHHRAPARPNQPLEVAIHPSEKAEGLSLGGVEGLNELI